jgi:hypothetical protein
MPHRNHGQRRTIAQHCVEANGGRCLSGHKQAGRGRDNRPHDLMALGDAVGELAVGSKQRPPKPR